MVAVSEDAPATEVLRLAIESRYSRIPVYRNSVDDIVGVVFSKKLLLSIDMGHEMPVVDKSWCNQKAGQLMDPTFYIPETMSTWKALQELKKRRVHLSIVVDEYGGTAGVVTLEDLLEEVVGEIYDEDDAEELQPDKQTILRDSAGGYLVKASAKLDEVCDALGLVLDEEELYEHSTIGGYLCSLVGAIPAAGEAIVLGDYTCTVLEVDARRILSVQVRRTDAGQDRVAEGESSLCEGEAAEERERPGYYSDGQWVAAMGDETASS